MINTVLMSLIVYNLFDDFEKLPQKEKSEMTEKEKEEAAQHKKLISLVAFAFFMITLGFMAGFETTMGLAVYSAFGWDTSESWKAYGAFGFSSIVSFAVAMPLTQKFNRSSLVVVCTILSNISLVGVNLTNLADPVPVWQFYVSLVGFIPTTILQLALQAIPTVDLPAHMQVNAQTMIQAAGQAGRGIGPIIAMAEYGFFASAFGEHSGYNAAVFFSAGAMAIGLAPLFCNFKLTFGSFSDPSPAQKKAAAAKEMH